VASISCAVVIASGRGLLEITRYQILVRGKLLASRKELGTRAKC
jgi:hypothetical protein